MYVFVKLHILYICEYIKYHNLWTTYIGVHIIFKNTFTPHSSLATSFFENTITHCKVINPQESCFCMQLFLCCPTTLYTIHTHTLYVYLYFTIPQMPHTHGLCKHSFLSVPYPLSYVRPDGLKKKCLSNHLIYLILSHNSYMSKKMNITKVQLSKSRALSAFDMFSEQMDRLLFWPQRFLLFLVREDSAGPGLLISCADPEPAKEWTWKPLWWAYCCCQMQLGSIHSYCCPLTTRLQWRTSTKAKKQKVKQCIIFPHKRTEEVASIWTGQECSTNGIPCVTQKHWMHKGFFHLPPCNGCKLWSNDVFALATQGSF